jgi:hypothetical protein
MVNEQSGDEWLLNREPPIALPRSRWCEDSAWGLPTVVPEVLLFFKATAYFESTTMASRNAKDEADFRALAPHLDDEAREWLRDAVAHLHPDHAWLPLLASSEGSAR